MNSSTRYMGAFFMLALVLTSHGLCGATELRTLSPGDWIRAAVIDPAHPGSRPVNHEGTLRYLDDSTIIINSSKSNSGEILKRENINSIEVRTRKGSRGKGASRGLLIGMLGGGLLGYAMGAPEHSADWMDPTGPELAVAGIVLGAPLGAMIGALVAPGAEWKPAPGAGTSISLRPLPTTGAMLTLKFDF